jgi:tRNA(Arg) A34 adenosine deaminase TadA
MTIRPELTHSPASLLRAFLSAAETTVLPLTAQGVSRGSKVFGAAIFRASDLSPVLAATNEESECPLWHGEVVAIRNFYNIDRENEPRNGLVARDCVFFSTHEPWCVFGLSSKSIRHRKTDRGHFLTSSLCLSAIAWSGFPHVFYLFSYQDTRDAFSIPHDIDILTSVFPRHDSSRQQDGDGASESEDDAPLYNRENRFFHSRSLADLVAELGSEEEKAEMTQWIDKIKAEYDGLAKVYQDGKGKAEIPLA